MGSIKDKGFVTFGKVVVTPVTSSASLAALQSSIKHGHTTQFSKGTEEYNLLRINNTRSDGEPEYNGFKVVDGMHRIEAYKRLYYDNHHQAKR
jgi:hypothetical protein